jgi:hypothetical protein
MKTSSSARQGSEAEMSNTGDMYFPSRIEEDQDMGPSTPVVAGPPPFSSPDPTTESRLMFNLSEGSSGGPSQEPQVEEDATDEERQAAIQEAAQQEQGVEGGQAQDENLDDMTKAELQDYADELGIEGTSGMNKSELKDAIQEAQSEQTQVIEPNE